MFVRGFVSEERCSTKLLVSICLLLLLFIGYVLYLPAAAAGCVRACGGVRRGDAPRSGGVGLGLLGLCCCLKNGLSKRPGGQDDTQPNTHPDTKIQTPTQTYNKDTKRRTRTEMWGRWTRQEDKTHKKQEREGEQKAGEVRSSTPEEKVRNREVCGKGRESRGNP